MRQPLTWELLAICLVHKDVSTRLYSRVNIQEDGCPGLEVATSLDDWFGAYYSAVPMDATVQVHPKLINSLLCTLA